MPSFPDRPALSWEPTREAGLAGLQAFHVPMLSPWIRHRLVCEEEVVRATLDRHGFRGAEKFIQEVVWPTYWNGWLEMRPGVWRRYGEAVESLTGHLDRDPALRGRFQDAAHGRTGIPCFGI
jgi:deoxyribodipyrimidine photo-lyase